MAEFKNLEEYIKKNFNKDDIVLSDVLYDLAEKEEETDLQENDDNIIKEIEIN